MGQARLPSPGLRIGFHDRHTYKHGAIYIIMAGAVAQEASAHGRAPAPLRMRWAKVAETEGLASTPPATTERKKAHAHRTRPLRG